jgi:hypothetical protein
MEEEGGAKVRFSLGVHSLDEAYRTFKVLPTVVVSNLCFKCFESNN